MAREHQRVNDNFADDADFADTASGGHEGRYSPTGAIDVIRGIVAQPLGLVSAHGAGRIVHTASALRRPEAASVTSSSNC